MTVGSVLSGGRIQCQWFDDKSKALSQIFHEDTLVEETLEGPDEFDGGLS